MDKKKVYIFGASVGGQTYYSLNKEKIEVLGFLDNDKKKHGTQLDGITIFTPEILKDKAQKEYDNIVISSMYIDSIIAQLSSLGISEDKLSFPPKSQLKTNNKPFETPAMRAKATNLLCALDEILSDEKCYLSFGTLLGIVRENQLLPWDDDIDLSIFPQDVERIINKIVANIDKLSTNFDFKVYKRQYDEMQIANISIYCFYEDNDLFHISLACLNETQPGMYSQEVNITPKTYFDGFDEIIFNGHTFKAPKNHLGYLAYTYGDWKTPRKDTSFFDNSLSYKEMGRVEKTICYYDYTNK